ncbi:penicillin acylase family protein [Chloroflexi bacterium CFX6]|nr:penicillin acylase family protein [Chloroflexi bacterium CFX6]
MSKTIFKRVGLGLLILVLLAGTGGAFYFKSYLPNTVAPKSFPQIEGEIQLEGLDGRVDVYRDAMGIPHIYASTQHDLFFAQGYVHAQDRFWQMDFWRHIGAGRIAEMFPSQAETDMFLRTLGWTEIAEQEYAALEPEFRAMVDSYTEGVNAYLKDHDKEASSLEYAILGLLNPDYVIEPWAPTHSLTWGKMLAYDLRGNMDEEIKRAILLKTLTPEQVDELFPSYPEDHPTIVNKIGAGEASSAAPVSIARQLPDETLAALQHNASLLDDLMGPANNDVGSNSWAVAGSRTATGMPILANDPHLAIQMPSIWYQIGLHCKPKTEGCPYDVAGFSMAGVPAVIIGHNDRIAWSMTNVGPDVMDLYIEKVNPENPNQYEANGQWVDFEIRKEIIKVAGGEPIEMDVRISRHGPVISEVFGVLKNEGDPEDEDFTPFKDNAGIELPEHYAIALKWTAFTVSSSFVAPWMANTAQNFEEFREAARTAKVPSQNLVYADVDGNIGYQMPGDIPIRKNGDGTLPVPGWTDDFEWMGYVPFEELPWSFNPPEGYIATANNQVPPRDYPHLISTDWDLGYRADRIVEMIENAPGKIDLAYIQKMQGDNFDGGAPYILPHLLEMKFDASNLNDGLAALKNWDYQASADSAPAALYEAFWRNLLAETFHDDLPERYFPNGGDTWFEITRSIVNDPSSFWWDDKTTTDTLETRDDIFARAFEKAVAELEDRLGKDQSQWKWGDLHTATFKNGTLGQAGIFLIEDLFNRGPFPTSGGTDIVNATSWRAPQGYEVANVPSMRMIVDLGNLNNSLTVHTTGQSGHAYHPHYIDMAELWANVEYYPMWWNLESVIEDSEGHLVLTP